MPSNDRLFEFFFQELVLRLEDCRSKERRLEELKHNLEVCLADATQQIQELKVGYVGTFGLCGIGLYLAMSVQRYL